MTPQTSNSEIGTALWWDTATSVSRTLPLVDSRECDAVVIGAGFTGLNAALRLARSGLSVVVLEKHHIGFGASGRSGGQVNLGLNEPPSALIHRFGKIQGTRLVSLVLDTPQRVFELIRREGLACDAVQQGWIQGAISQIQARRHLQIAEDYAAHGYPFEVLDRTEMEHRIGSSRYELGLYSRDCGSVQPLSYTRELARKVLEAGAFIHTDTPVTGIESVDGGWRIQTPNARVKTAHVLICTNGYTAADIGPYGSGLPRRVVPVRSVLVATEPLDEPMRGTILPGQVTFVDKRRMILYMRYDRTGRLCIGDHGPMRDHFRASDFLNVKRRAMRIFPQLSSVRWDYHWGGRVAMTRNGLPFIHRIAPGLIAGMGFNGRGVGMGSVMGQVLADGVLDDNWHELEFPVTQPKPFLLHRFHTIGVAATARWYALMDYLDTINRHGH